MVAAVGATVVALLGVLGVLWQKNRQDRYANWWTQTRWALDALTSDDVDHRLVGYAAATALVASPAARQADRRMLADVADVRLDVVRSER